MLGRRFGKLLVLERMWQHPTVKRDGIYKCRCDCGTVCEARGTSLRRGHKKSCGCLQAQASPWVGKQVGQLLVLERLPNRKYRCLCGCGSEVISTSIWSRNRTLQKGADVHCGGPAHKKPTPIHEVVRPTLASKHPLYSIYRGIIRRCTDPTNPSYVWYGKVGVSICPEWKADFWAFVVYMDTEVGERPTLQHSLDRIDPYGDYGPGNVRWATPLEQGRNKRGAHAFRYKGILWPTRTAAEDAWAADGKPPCWEFTPWLLGADVRRQMRVHEVDADKKARAERRAAAAACRAERRAERRAAAAAYRAAQAHAAAQLRRADLLNLARLVFEVLVFRRQCDLVAIDVDVLARFCAVEGVASTQLNCGKVFKRIVAGAAMAPELFTVGTLPGLGACITVAERTAMRHVEPPSMIYP